MARLAIFVDGGYIDALCRYEFAGVQFDFQKLADEITHTVGDRTSEPVDLLRAHYYHCPPHQGNPPTEDEKRRYSGYRRFTDALTRLPRFEVREGRLQYQGRRDDGSPIFQQKRLDLLLGLDIALLAGKQQITHIALVAGDGDFIPAAEVAKREGVSVWLFHGPQSGQDGRPTYSSDLWLQADERVELDDGLVGKIKRA